MAAQDIGEGAGGHDVGKPVGGGPYREVGVEVAGQGPRTGGEDAAFGQPGRDRRAPRVRQGTTAVQTLEGLLKLSDDARQIGGARVGLAVADVFHADGGADGRGAVRGVPGVDPDADLAQGREDDGFNSRLISHVRRSR